MEENPDYSGKNTGGFKMTEKVEKKKKQWVDVTFDEKDEDVATFLNTYSFLADKAKIYTDTYGIIHALVFTKMSKEELEV